MLQLQSYATLHISTCKRVVSSLDISATIARANRTLLCLLYCRNNLT